MPVNNDRMLENPYQTPNDATTSDAATTLPLNREIRLSGSMPLSDVLHTQLLILSRRWLYAVLCLAMYVGFVLACGMLNPSESLFGNTFATLGLVVMPAILPFTLLMVYLRLRRDCRQQIGIFAITETILAADGIHSRTISKTANIPWDSFSSFIASSRVVLLFLRDSNNHLIVSRHKLSNPEDWAYLLEFLHSRFPTH